MSGHSKWHNIQAKKGKADAARGRIFTKLGREIAVAAKGNPNPDTNSKLADAIAKAKANNMPNDNIMRCVKKAAGELGNVNYETLVYEGYGVGGSALIINTLTDNKNRTAGDVRSTLAKCGGELGNTGCVSYMFSNKGLLAGFGRRYAYRIRDRSGGGRYRYAGRRFRDLYRSRVFFLGAQIS